MKNLQTSTAKNNPKSHFDEYITIGQKLLKQVWKYILFVVLLISIICAAVLFPHEEFIQWAARKPFCRKFFNLKHVPIAAQTKFLKTEEKLY